MTLYAKGTMVVFKSRNGDSLHDGKKGEVIGHGNFSNSSELIHLVMLEGNYEIGAYPEELEITVKPVR